MPPLKDRTGQRYGRLVVLERAPNGSHNRVFWKCKCDCGNIVDVAGGSLQKGCTKSCGCLNTETRRELGRKNKKDLVGKKFGKLTVIEDSTKRTVGQQVIWICKCDCGNILEVQSGNLTSGNTKSCGCTKRSNGEDIIKTILKNNNINFKEEFIIKELYYKDIHSKMRFDFLVFYNNKKYIIEFDGKQHFKEITGSWNLNLKEIRERDKIKNEYCFNNNLPLIRIPYSHINNIKLNDLLLETTSFLITKETEEEYYANNI